MAGLSIEFFNDFMSATGSLIVTSAQEMVNEAVYHTNILSRFLVGEEYTKVVQGGTEVKDDIFFDEQNTAEYFQPGERADYQNPQVVQEHSAPWRFKRDHKAWNESEIILNSGGNMSGDDARFQQVLDMKRKLDYRLWTSWCKSEESDLWRVPDATEMERTATVKGSVAYSLLAAVNEWSNGEPGNGLGWATATTFQGLDPGAAATNSKWIPNQQTYAGLPPGTKTADWDLWDALELAWMETYFEQLPIHPEFSETSTQPEFIATSKLGKKYFLKGLRNSNENLYLKQDAHYPGPVFGGVPILWIEALDSVAFYDDGSSGLATEAAGDKQGPRYYGFNPKYICPVYHAERYMHERPVSSHHNQPDTFAQQVVTYKQLFTRSRQRHFVISPSATLT